MQSQRKLKPTEVIVQKCVITKFSYVRDSVLLEHKGTGSVPQGEMEMLRRVYIHENLSCASKIELPYYSVGFFKKICVHCGVAGTSRLLGDALDVYPKCAHCKDKAVVRRPKRKTVVAGDLASKR